MFPSLASFTPELPVSSGSLPTTNASVTVTIPDKVGLFTVS